MSGPGRGSDQRGEARGQRRLAVQRIWAHPPPRPPPPHLSTQLGAVVVNAPSRGAFGLSTNAGCTATALRRSLLVELYAVLFTTPIQPPNLLGHTKGNLGLSRGGGAGGLGEGGTRRAHPPIRPPVEEKPRHRVPHVAPVLLQQVQRRDCGDGVAAFGVRRWR